MTSTPKGGGYVTFIEIQKMQHSAKHNHTREKTQDKNNCCPKHKPKDERLTWELFLENKGVTI